MNILNYTGHQVKFNTGVCLEADGVLNASEMIKIIDRIQEIPVVEKVYGRPPLPEPEENTIIIVAKMICEMFPERGDLYSVMDVVKDPHTKKPLYAKGITRNPYFRTLQAIECGSFTYWSSDESDEQ